MNVSSKVRINKTMVKQLEQRAAIALEQTAEALHTEIVQAQVMPRDTGNLQNEKSNIAAGEFVKAVYNDGKVAINGITKCKDGKVSIITVAPQARRLYFNPQFNFHRQDWIDKQGNKHGSNPNAKGHWFEDWQEGGKNADFCKKAFERNLRRLMK